MIVNHYANGGIVQNWQTRPAAIVPNCPKHAQTIPNMPKLSQTCPNYPKLSQTRLFMPFWSQTSPNTPKQGKQVFEWNYVCVVKAISNTTGAPIPRCLSQARNLTEPKRSQSRRTPENPGELRRNAENSGESRRNPENSAQPRRIPEPGFCCALCLCFESAFNNNRQGKVFALVGRLTDATVCASTELGRGLVCGRPTGSWSKWSGI